MCLCIEARKPPKFPQRPYAKKLTWKLQVRRTRIDGWAPSLAPEYEILIQVSFAERRCIWSVWKTHAQLHEFHRTLKRHLGWQMKAIKFPKDQAKQERKGARRTEEFLSTRMARLNVYLGLVTTQFQYEATECLQELSRFATHFDPIARVSQVCQQIGANIEHQKKQAPPKYFSPRHKRQASQRIHYSRLSAHAT